MTGWVTMAKYTRRMAIASGTCVSWVGLYAPLTIASNVKLMKRVFNACQTHRNMYPSIFNRFPVIQPVSLQVRHFCTFWPPLGTPWDNRGKFYMDRKRSQCLSNASQHVSICLQPFLRYSDISVASDWIVSEYSTPLFNGPTRARGWSRRNFAKILIHTKLEWMGYRVVKKAWRYVQPFWYNTSVWQTDRQNWYS